MDYPSSNTKDGNSSRRWDIRATLDYDPDNYHMRGVVCCLQIA